MLKNRSGFTLIETTIALALTLGFAVLAVGFFAGLRNQAQFSDSIDTLRNEILARREETVATVKGPQTLKASGTDSDNISIGRMLTFTPGSSTVVVSALESTNTNGAYDPSAPVTVVHPTTDAFDITIPWNASYQSSCDPATKSVYVVFIRDQIDGSLITSASVGNWPNYRFDTLTSNAARTKTFDLPLLGSGQGGILSFNAQNSNVSVKYNGATAAGSLPCPN